MTTEAIILYGFLASLAAGMMTTVGAIPCLFIKKISEKDIRKYLLPPEDVWLAGTEAKELGICDNVRQIK